MVYLPVTVCHYSNVLFLFYSRLLRSAMAHLIIIFMSTRQFMPLFFCLKWFCFGELWPFFCSMLHEKLAHSLFCFLFYTQYMYEDLHSIKLRSKKSIHFKIINNFSTTTNLSNEAAFWRRTFALLSIALRPLLMGSEFDIDL